MKAFVTIRNICAHGGTLYDYNARTGIGLIPSFGIEVQQRKKLGGFLKLISYYVGIISQNRKTEFEQKLNKILFNPDFSDKIKKIIETKSSINEL